jgi:hypothetical protein
MVGFDDLQHRITTLNSVFHISTLRCAPEISNLDEFDGLWDVAPFGRAGDTKALVTAPYGRESA